MIWFMEILSKAFNIDKNLKYDGYQRGAMSKFHQFLDKAILGGAVTRETKSEIKNKIMLNQQVAEKLHQPIIRNFGKRKVYTSFQDNIWGADLADIQLISKYN